MTTDDVRAACLTPPAMGGVAVIQMVGRGAAALLLPHLQSRRPLDLDALPPDELRLVQVVEDGEIIDDALVCLRHTSSGRAIVDLSLHGGPRIVQRVLIMLSRAGVRIVESADLLADSWDASSAIEREALHALISARTRTVATWLARVPPRLTAGIQFIIAAIDRGDLDRARASLGELIERAPLARYLLLGVRVVLVGEPNTGKSTLANALTEREQAIVSEIPGTTRDWIEHPAAVHGIPFTFVDTAGVRVTDDPIEEEAIRRSREQLASADLILWISDLSRAPTILPNMWPTETRRQSNTIDRPSVYVWNKSDLPPHPDQEQHIRQAGERGASVSGRTGAGLSDLGQQLVRLLNLTGGPDWPAAPFTDRQIQACRSAETALGRAPADPQAATDALQFLLEPATKT